MPIRSMVWRSLSKIARVSHLIKWAEIDETAISTGCPWLCTYRSEIEDVAAFARAVRL